MEDLHFVPSGRIFARLMTVHVKTLHEFVTKDRLDTISFQTTGRFHVLFPAPTLRAPRWPRHSTHGARRLVNKLWTNNHWQKNHSAQNVTKMHPENTSASGAGQLLLVSFLHKTVTSCVPSALPFTHCYNTVTVFVSTQNSKWRHARAANAAALPPYACAAALAARAWRNCACLVTV